MIQLTQTAIVSEPGDIARLKQEFAETGCARLPGFLAPPILKSLIEWIESAQFEERHETRDDGEVFGATLFVPQTEPVFFLLQFILNRPDLYRISEQVSGCPRIGNFIGRLHRTTPAASQHIDWHRDLVDARRLGFCINLSSEPYTGGLFQIRDPEYRVTASVGPSAPGDACFFRIDNGWQHRLTSVESGCRTVGVGWFRTNPDWCAYAPNIGRVLRMTELANHKVQD